MSWQTGFLENLNVNYVIPEDFTVYKKLKRPTARAIFGLLHMWFKATDGPVERDYDSLLCACSLSVKSYKFVSKIKSTMGKALDELVAIRYLSPLEGNPADGDDRWVQVCPVAWPG